MSDLTIFTCHLQSKDSQAERLALGDFEAENEGGAEKQARKKYSGLFKRLVCDKWFVDTHRKAA